MPSTASAWARPWLSIPGHDAWTMLGVLGIAALVGLALVILLPAVLSLEDYFLPLGRFDNRVDKTSFIREEPADWAEADVAALQAGMKEAFDHLMHGFGD